jgi:galactokinase
MAMDLTEAFQARFSALPAIRVRAPGRVNLLGEHLGDSGGPILTAAIDRDVRLAARSVPARTVTLAALDLGEAAVFSLDALEDKLDTRGNPLPVWARYPAGVAWALQEAGFPLSGLEAAFTSDVPVGAGLASSAAVEVAFAVLWQSAGGWPIDRLSLARLCQRAEHAYVGVSCGLMDHFASACGVAGQALYLDTRSLDWRPAPLPPGTALVIADSGVQRDPTSSAHNERRAACKQAVEVLQAYLPEVCSLRDVQPTYFAAYSDRLPPIVRQRAEHVVKEIARVETALIALQRADKRTFGALMYSSHASLRGLYAVSLPELDALVEIARRLPGCIGARLTGLGGCTVNLVEEAQAEAFIQGLRECYQERTGRPTQVYLCQASAGASVL